METRTRRPQRATYPRPLLSCITRHRRITSAGENSNLSRGLLLSATSTSLTSRGMGGKGGMPCGFLAVTSDGVAPNTGIVWTLTPLSGDANMHVVRGVLRAYDATNLDPMPNSDGTPRLKLLWHSDHIPNNAFNHS